MRIFNIAMLWLCAYLAGAIAQPGSVSIGAAPKGDPMKVASRIIKYNFPNCRRVSAASRLSDGSIRATCDGTDYRVFTVYSAAEGKMVEIAMNCSAARRHNVAGC
jgi:hypothetical protein